MKFANPYLLLLILPVAVFLVFYYRNKLFLAQQTLVLSAQHNSPGSFSRFFPFLRYIALAFLIIAAAAPYENYRLLPDETRGVDIMLALDVSGSMVNIPDFRPGNRLEVAKKLLQGFISKRDEDRLGLVVFAGSAFMQSPLTSDHEALSEIVAGIVYGMAGDGTAVGDALITSVYRLKESRARSRIIVILTDGASNAGRFDPETAADVTLESGVKVYSLGIGSTAEETDFDLLAKIAQKTGGRFYRAKNPEELAEVFNAIDELERDPLPARPRMIIEQKYGGWFAAGILLLLTDLIVRTFIRRQYV